MIRADGHDLIVAGGGPAGATAAAIAARRGLRVLLLEAGAHPRVKVGESLLPGIIPILDEAGALAAVEAAGFTRKTGATHWRWGRTPQWDLWFADTDAYDHAWIVERARFDHILFDAARRAGADAHERAAVKRVLWDGDRATGVEWQARGDDRVRRAEAPFVVDATGASALISRDLELRTLVPGLRHRASWAHYEDGGRLPAPRADQALLVAAEQHWVWYFPLTPELTSVGVVFQEDDRTDDQRGREADFDAALAACPDVLDLLGERARRVTAVITQRDWSYRMSRVAGPGWLLAGDSSGFIDPVLSTGVFLAMHAGRHAAHTVANVLGGADETAALADYEHAHRELLNDVMRIVRFFYQRNLDRDDYFWESKRMLTGPETRLAPQRAFLALTSGLVKNLALDDKRAAIGARHRERVATSGHTLDVHDPDELGFVCVHLRHVIAEGVAPADIYLLVEPVDPGAPARFTTRNWHVNFLAPRYDNDPICEPSLAPALSGLAATIDRLDIRDGDDLSRYWRTHRAELMAGLRALPPAFELVRIFGE